MNPYMVHNRGANQLAGRKGGIPLPFHIARFWPALPHHDRYVPLPSHE
jgi:hypothetical protein